MNVQQDPADPACRYRFAVASRLGHLKFNASIIALLAISICSLGSCPLASAQTAPAAQAKDAAGKCPPATRKDSVVDVLHGVSIPDPYRWLEDQDSPETRAWLNAENRCTEDVLRSIPGRAQIAKRLGELQKTDSFATPFRCNGVAKESVF